MAVRPDGGDAGDTGDGGFLACGAVIPAIYQSPAYATNAQVELDMRAHAFEIDRKMQTTEGASTAILTSAELMTAFHAGSPSLRAATTAPLQTTIDDYLVAYGNAVGRTWTAQLAEGDGGAPAGGKFDGQFHVSAVGLDLREATARTFLAGTFFNHAASLASGAVTEATIDRLVAAYGATPTFANRTDDAAGEARDGLSAALASQRDDKSQPSGFYRRIQYAVLSAKVASISGEPCRADLQAALATFFREWERALYASAIYSLDATVQALAASPPKGAVALRTYGDAVGLMQGFRAVPQERRTITDLQIDGLLGKIGVSAPYLILTDTAAKVPGFVGAIQDIAGIYGFTQADVEAFKIVH